MCMRDHGEVNTLYQLPMWISKGETELRGADNGAWQGGRQNGSS